MKITLFFALLATATVQAIPVTYTCEVFLRRPELRIQGTKEVTLDGDKKGMKEFLNPFESLIGDTIPFSLVATPVNLIPRGKEPLHYRVVVYSTSTDHPNFFVSAFDVKEGSPIRTTIKVDGRYWYVDCEPK